MTKAIRWEPEQLKMWQDKQREMKAAALGRSLTRSEHNEFRHLQPTGVKLARARVEMQGEVQRKYRNQRFEAEGERWDSKKEYRYWQHLRALQEAGRIANLRRQVPFQIEVNGQHICEYRADFTYNDRSGPQERFMVIDVKGYLRTPAYQLKKHLLRACHGLEITEI